MDEGVKMSKYHNVKTIIEGIKFDSKKEAARYKELCLLFRAGEIKDLECQPKYPIKINGQKICSYIADFRYRNKGKGEWIIEDVKGFKTAIYRLKKKLVFALYGVEVNEV